MKAKVLRGVCIAGESRFPGEVVELDPGTFSFLKSTGQVTEAEEPKPAAPIAPEPPKQSKKGKK